MNKITDRQRNFIKKLLDEKDCTGIDTELLWKSLRISEDPEEFGMSTAGASSVINTLLKLPRLAVAQPERVALPALPPGRYAIENEQGELRFYQLWESKDGRRRNLYVLFGPSDARLFPKTQVAIIEKILEAGAHECAVRFGNEIGACSKCGRRLTNRISRELGIGPVCGGRTFDGDWDAEVKAARKRIKDRGENPDEEMAELERQVKKLESWRAER